MKLSILAGGSETAFPIPGSMALRLLAMQLKKGPLTEYLLEGNHSALLYKELASCAERFPKLKLCEVFPVQGDPVVISLKE